MKNPYHNFNSMKPNFSEGPKSKGILEDYDVKKTGDLIITSASVSGAVLSAAEVEDSNPRNVEDENRL